MGSVVTCVGEVRHALLLCVPGAAELRHGDACKEAQHETAPRESAHLTPPHPTAPRGGTKQLPYTAQSREKPQCRTRTRC